ncbi:MAG: response regulator [Acidobacteriota bacterium]
MKDVQISQTFRILVVDDNEADVYLLRQALKKAGVNCELTIIEDGSEGLAFSSGQGKYSGGPIHDLAVIDLNLPMHGGDDILKRMRENQHLEHVPVVIWTSSATSLERAKVEAMGITRFMTKPMDLEDFMRIGEAVKEVLLEIPRVESITL